MEAHEEARETEEAKADAMAAAPHGCCTAWLLHRMAAAQQSATLGARAAFG
jgi:hypothetical protein